MWYWRRGWFQSTWVMMWFLSKVLQHTLQLSDSTLRRETQVKLILTPMNMLYDEIIKGRQELEDFATKYDQGLVDSDKAASVQRKLQQTRQYLSDFESRLTQTTWPYHSSVHHWSSRWSRYIFNKMKSCVTTVWGDRPTVWDPFKEPSPNH